MLKKAAVLVSVFTLSAILLAFMQVPVVASTTYNGIYDYSYGFNGPNGWESHDVPSGFIVQDGQISSKPSALSGAVDASGNVRFTGPCPQGDNTAVFTGKIYSNGMGSGSYECSYGHSGEWSVIAVSGFTMPTIPAYGGSSSPDFDISNILAGLGGIFGLKGDNAMALGAAMFIVASVLAATAIILGVSAGISAVAGFMGIGKHGRSPAPGYHKELGYKVSQPASPAAAQETSAPIGIGQDSHVLEDFGKVSVDPSLPASLDLHASWPKGKVDLTWKPPAFDPGTYRLDGYTVSVMQYGPGSTGPVKVPISRLPPGTTQWTGPFNQTYKFSTGGDIEGYTVEAQLSNLSSTGHTAIFRVGAMAYAPPA
jgi:hypothetical protein